MNPLAYFRSLTARFLHRSQTEREMKEELSSHIRSRADDLERAGLDRAEAERRARIEFGIGRKVRVSPLGKLLQMTVNALRKYALSDLATGHLGSGLPFPPGHLPTPPS